MSGLSFFVPGIPAGKGRPRFVKATGRAYTPAKTANYEGLIALAGSDAMDGRALMVGPLSVKVTATFPVPASWPAKRKAAAVYHDKKPDADNIIKAVGDALNGVVWEDDSRIARVSVSKVYGDKPGLHVFVEALA